MAGIYLFQCEPLFTEWLERELSRKLLSHYTLHDRDDPDYERMMLPLFCYVAIADKKAIRHSDWKEYLKVRRNLGSGNWLILFDVEEYDIRDDEKALMVKTPKEVVGALVKFYMTDPPFGEVGDSDEDFE